MDGRLRNMSSVYISQGNKMLLLYRQGSRVVNDVWVGSAGGHFEEYELNDARKHYLDSLYILYLLSNGFLNLIKIRSWFRL